MKSNSISVCVAAASKVFMTIVIFLVAVLILQSIAIELGQEILRVFKPAERRMPEAQQTAEPPMQLTKEELRLDRISNSDKQFLPDGTIHLIHRLEQEAGRRHGPEKIQIYDANDSLLWQGPAGENLYEYLSWSDTWRHWYLVDRNSGEEDLRRIQMITPEFSRVLEIPVRAQDGTDIVWRYLPESDLFLAYDLDCRIIGFLGSNRFTQSKEQAKPFGKFKSQSGWYPAGAPEPTLLWLTTERLYEINFQNQQVELLLESPQSDIECIYTRNYRPLPADTSETPKKIHYRPTIQCLTEDGKHHLIIKDPDQKLTITSAGDSDALFLAATNHGIFLFRRDTETRPPAAYLKSSKLCLQWIRKFEGKPHREWVELYKVDEQARLHLLNRFEWIVPARPSHVTRRHHTRYLLLRGVAVVSPPLYDLIWLPPARQFLNRHRWDNDFIFALTRMTGILLPGGSIYNWLLGLAMISFALWHAWLRRTSKAKLVFWLILVGLFNLAGLLTYLALNHTPVIECPVCSNCRGLERVDCVRCGAEFPRPQPTEHDLIFDTSLSAQEPKT